MATIQDIDFQIAALNELYEDFLTHNDSIDITDENQKVYVTTESLLYNTKVCSDTSIQKLEQVKRDSLVEYEYITKEDTTIFNICSTVYKVVNDTNFDMLITANDLDAFNRTDIDPMNPLIKKGTKIIYYK